ncbi:hypothetical protein BDV33DRAFT_179580 [Aspergillus novoparasiticus]|uniref:Uncharacterized protein n=1 Tax=Aspergillus novoparasiticus TaxID=986946 RepID=A0A5N6EGC2_9EURO|nr:hypothetical protein BDV33DRAFT_179580 [Aspergillus novoparasiticus]
MISNMAPRQWRDLAPSERHPYISRLVTTVSNPSTSGAQGTMHPEQPNSDFRSPLLYQGVALESTNRCVLELGFQWLGTLLTWLILLFLSSS